MLTPWRYFLTGLNLAALCGLAIFASFVIVSSTYTIGGTVLLIALIGGRLFLAYLAFSLLLAALLPAADGYNWNKFVNDHSAAKYKKNDKRDAAKKAKLIQHKNTENLVLNMSGLQDKWKDQITVDK